MGKTAALVRSIWELFETELKSFARGKFELIFTPPYCPDLQPIELVWALTKRFVASQWKSVRTLEETRDQVFVSWYGGFGKMKEAIKPMSQRCNKLVERSLERANLRIQRADSGVSGNIRHPVLDPEFIGELYTDHPEHAGGLDDSFGYCEDDELDNVL